VFSVKKIISVILALVFAFCFSVNAFAETVELEEYKLSLEVPEGWYAVTKDTPEDSEIFEYYVYYDAAMELFEEYGIAAYIISEDGYSEIFFEPRLLSAMKLTALVRLAFSDGIKFFASVPMYK
jgi:hypothetical protein